MANRLLDRVNAVSPAVTSLSPAVVQALTRTATSQPSKVIQVNFTGDKGENIPVTVDAGQEESLLALLQRAKRVAS